MKIAYVDLCRTITNFYTLGKFLREFLYFSNKPKFIMYIINLILNKFFNHFTTERKVRFLEGTTESQYLNFCNLFFEKDILPNLNSATLKKITELQNNGYSIVIVSAALYDYIKPLQQHINADAIIASQIHINDSKLTGTCTFNYNHSKVIEIQKYEQTLSSRIENRVAISDHISDLPMLEFAHTPIVTKPGSDKLLKIAQSKKWEVINNEFN